MEESKEEGPEGPSGGQLSSNTEKFHRARWSLLGCLVYAEAPQAQPMSMGHPVTAAPVPLRAGRKVTGRA